MLNNQYYTVYESVKTQDNRGNVVENWLEKTKIKGSIIDKEQSFLQLERGQTINYVKLFICKRDNINKVKIGDKIEDLIIEKVFTNAGFLVLVLRG